MAMERGKRVSGEDRPDYRALVAALGAIKGTRDDRDHPRAVPGADPLLSQLLLDQERVEPTEEHGTVEPRRGVPK
jgi:hypothetical protein